MAAPGLELALGESMNVVNCCIFPLHLLPQPSWLLHPPIDTRPIDRSSNRFEPVGGQLFHPFPLPRTSCAEKQLQPAIAPSSCCRWGCFVSPNAKLTASRAAEARGGISDGVWWLLWPSSDDLEAIGHGFDSIVSSIGDDGVCACCAWKSLPAWWWLQKSRTLIPCVVMSVDCQCWIFVNGYSQTLAMQYRISELCIFKVRYCEMLRSELGVHRNSFDPRLDAVEFFVADTGFCWVGTLSDASGSCVRPFF